MANAKIGLYALAIKLGPKILGFGLKALKGLKAGKGIMAATSLGAYSYLFTWQFAVLILLMLFVHESGHIWAMKKCGMRTKGIYFIPFLGAAAVTDEEFKTRNDEQFIAIMGPVWGLGLSVLAVVAYGVTENPFFAAIASWWAMINLFNLLPMNPLDGGRIVKSIAFSLHSYIGLVFLIVGFAASLYIAVAYQVALFGFLVVVGGIELFVEFWGRKRRQKNREKHNAEMKEMHVQYELARLAHLNKHEEKTLALIDEAFASGEFDQAEAEQERQKITAHVESNRKKTLESSYVEEKYDDPPKMNKEQIASSAFTFLGVAALLFAVMVYMSDIPGADAAMEVLKD